MTLWIKICANTSLEDALLAAQAGADAVGFVFAAASKRRVTAEQVAAITPHLPAHVEKIGVFVDAGFDEIVRAVEAGGLTGIQLQFEAPPELTPQLRNRFGASVRMVGVLHFGGSGPIQPELFADPHLDAVLVDSRTPTAPGGTGIAYDWQLAGDLLFRNAAARDRGKLIAAGGLRPDNVAEAIRILRPWGVDVASGVESAPGRKDPARLRAFITNARAAERR